MEQILTDSYVTFVTRTFGPQLIPFLSSDYESLYKLAIVDLWKKTKNMDIHGEDYDEFTDLKYETIDTIPTPIVDSCNEVFYGADETIQDAIDALRKLS